MSIFSRLSADFRSFWEALGPRLARFWGQNGVQERWNPWGKTICFSLWPFLCPKFEFSLIWGGLGSVLGRFGEYLGMILEDFWPDFLKFWETHHLCLEIAHYMRFKTIALQKWLNKNGLHPWKHVSHPWEQFCFFNLSTFWSFRDTMFLYSIFTKIEVCGFPKISNATETLPVSSVWVTPGRTIWQLSFWNKYYWLHVQRRLLSYQICSTITSQIIPRHLIAGPAECAQRWNLSSDGTESACD